MRMRNNRLAAVVAGAAMAVTLTACGSGSDVPEVVDPAASTGSEQDAAGESSGPPTGSEETVEAGTELSPEEFMARIKAPGPERLGSFTVEMEMSGQGQAMTMQGAADVRGENPLMQLTVDVPDMGSVEIIMAEGEVFMAMPGLTQEGQYMRVDPAELGLDLGELTGSLDMESTFAAWDEGTQSVTFVGTEEVDGEELDHYTLSVDAAAASDAAGETMPPGMPDTITYDVWLDSEDLMRTVEFDVQGVGAELRVDNWGEDVDIQVPDESQVIDFQL